MHTDVCQRAHGFRPAGEVIDTSRYEVVQARSWSPIRAFILEEHYSRSFPQTSRGFELRGPGGKLVGAATFSVVARMYQAPFGEPARWLCLSRFVLADEVPGNGETWMLARCFAVLRSEGFAGVVSYSDPVPRLDGHGRAAFRGHIGTIYQAHNAVFTGRSKPETKWLLPDGGVFESRAANKLTAGDTGRAYAERGLVHFGASPLAPGEDPAAWLAKWRQAICRPIKHGGNLRYVWSLNHRDRRYLPPGLPYPRFPARSLSALAARLSPAPAPARVAA